MKSAGGESRPIIFQVPQPALGHRVFLLRGLMWLGASVGAAIALAIVVKPVAAWFALIPAGAGLGQIVFYVWVSRSSVTS